MDKQTAELIAAGEVVDRPASVAKELIENAIDAGASAVTVEIERGGVLYLRVTDNGSGFLREDIPTAFLRHATSKIRAQDDLDNIGTLGFRGEALAAVAAVSRIELTTRTAEELAGSCYRIEGGEEAGLEDAGCPTGSTIVIRDLFYNTPARMKFLKKDISEANAVSAVVDRQALSHPEVAFTFIRDGKTTLRTPGDGKLMSAVYQVCGREFAGSLLPLSYEQGGVWLNGFICKPTACRPNRNLQYFYINGRLVKSRTMMAALEQAYKNSAMVGKFPACVLHMHIPCQTVDVNVHPAKLEVRFSDEKRIFDAVYYGARTALAAGDARPQMRLGKETGKGAWSYPAERMEQRAAVGAYQQMLPELARSGGQGPSDRMEPSDPSEQLVQDVGPNREARSGQAGRSRQEGQSGQGGPASQAGPLDQKGQLGKEIRSGQESQFSQGSQSSQESQNGQWIQTGQSGQWAQSIQTGGQVLRGESAPADDGWPPAAQSAASIWNGGADLQLSDTGQTLYQGGGLRMPSLDIEVGDEPETRPAQKPEAGFAPRDLPTQPSGTAGQEPGGTNTAAAASDGLPAEPEEPAPHIRVIGELFRTYVLCEQGDELILLDKHAAHERILYEELQKSEEPRQQLLLVPEPVRLSREEYAAIMENIPLLQKAGYDVDDFGGSSVMVRALPVALSGADVKSLMAELAGGFMEHRRSALPERLDWLYHSVACRAAVKAGDASQPAELERLADRVLSSKDIMYCPHGRPVAVRLTRGELEKQFGRIQ